MGTNRYLLVSRRRVLYDSERFSTQVAKVTAVQRLLPVIPAITSRLLPSSSHSNSVILVASVDRFQLNNRHCSSSGPL